MEKFDNLSNPKPDKILLMLMPFWAPFTPPQGISCLKAALKRNGYQAKTIDANIIPELWHFHSDYLTALRELHQGEKKGNFNMVGYDVLINHFLIHLNAPEDAAKYQEIVKTIVVKSFYLEITGAQAQNLIQIVTMYYEVLQKYILELIAVEQPGFLGISVYNPTLASSLFTFRIVKEHFPDITTIMGGGIFADNLAPGSINFQSFIEKTPYIDKIIIGEGEQILLEFLRGNLPQTQKVYTKDEINGKYLDLAAVDLPDFADFHLDMYPQLTAYASRSCPFQCSFCSETVQWGRYRKKDIPQFVDEMVELNRIYNKRLFVLADSLINPMIMDLSHELIKRDKNLYWDVYLRADPEVCNEENTSLWRRGGFYRARLGIESGSQHVLNLMNKKTTPAQIKQALKCLANVGIKTTTYWVVGHPGETEADFQETLRFMEEIQDYIYEANWHPFYFYPNGQVNSSDWLSENSFSSLYPPEVAERLAAPTWILDTYPSRDEIYDRIYRIASHCNKLNLPDLYSLIDIYNADKRWQDLHKNSVPSLYKFIS